MVSYDQAKAFDLVSHEYLFNVLRAFVASEKFVSWIALLYTDISSSVLVNGFISVSFSVLRSIRQGCPLSALLYVLCIEPLAIGIRQDPRIRGLKLPGARERVRLLGVKKNFVVSGNPTDPSFYPPTLKILWTYLC